MLVIGGGIAGLSAAIAAARQGADVVLADDDVEPGGALLAEGGHERVRALADEARAAGVEVLSKAPALGFYDGLVPIWQGDTLHQVRAKRHVAATGAIEQPLVFKDNDLPGVMMTGGARRLAALWAVRPGHDRGRRHDRRPRPRRRARAARGGCARSPRSPTCARTRPTASSAPPCRPPASGCWRG